MEADRIFDAIAGDWQERHPVARAWAPLFARYFRKSDVVLDAGCGNAVNAIAFAPVVKKIIAVDTSPAMLAFARKNIKTAKLGRKITLKRASVLSLPFPDGFFDAVIYFAVVHHFQNLDERERVFAEMNRVLKRGGLALVTVWNKLKREELELLANRNMLVNFTKRTGERVPRLHHFYSAREISALARRHGFSVERLFYERSGRRVSAARGKNLCMVLRKAR